jgi:DUF971 family protein
VNPEITPIRLDLKKNERLEIDWQDGLKSVYPLPLLRSMCPCAVCKNQREEQSKRKSLLTILPGNYSGEISVLHAELVGNYALHIDWSDQHGAGIYSFQYLRELSPQKR